MIKTALRKVVSRKTISRFKIRKDYSYYANYIKEIEKETEDFDYLIGTPIHVNLGDHFISIAEIEFLNQIGYNKKIFDIPTEMFLLFGKRLLNKADTKTTIFINGGGWMGNLWPVEEQNLQLMVKTFRNFKMVIFPQTIYYDDKLNGYQKLLNKSINIYNNCDNLTISLRDRHSYLFAKKFYKNANLLYCPDIVLSYPKYTNKPFDSKPKKVVGFCLRKDRESVFNEEYKNYLKEYFTRNKWKSIEISTIASRPVPLEQRLEMVQNRLEEFSKCDLIVTDRLHGMLFSYMVNTPCIVFDNKTKKVSGTYNAWLKREKGILFINNTIKKERIEQFIESDFKNIEEDDLSDCFKELKKVILYGRN